MIAILGTDGVPVAGAAAKAASRARPPRPRAASAFRSTAIYRAVRPHQSHGCGLAPWSSRYFATTGLLLSSATIIGVMPSGFGRSTSTPASTMAFTQPRHPERAAYSSGVRPPVGRYCTRGSLVICVSQSVAFARTERSAPFETRNATMSAWLSPAAHITAV